MDSFQLLTNSRTQKTKKYAKPCFQQVQNSQFYCIISLYLHEKGSRARST